MSTKRLFVMVAIVLATCTAVMASVPLGPPVSNLSRGQWSIGADYSDVEIDVDTDLGELKGLDADLIFGRIGYGLGSNMDIYGLVGATDGEVGSWDSGYEFAWGFAVKGTLVEDDVLPWGFVYQMIWVDLEDSVGGANADFEAYDIKAAVGPSYNMGSVSIYGGPMAYYISGDVDAGIGPITANVDIDQDLQFGGYGGIGWEMSENWCLAGEYEYTHDLETIGVSLQYKF